MHKPEMCYKNTIYYYINVIYRCFTDIKEKLKKKSENRIKFQEKVQVSSSVLNCQRFIVSRGSVLFLKASSSQQLSNAAFTHSSFPRLEVVKTICEAFEVLLAGSNKEIEPVGKKLSLMLGNRDLKCHQSDFEKEPAPSQSQRLSDSRTLNHLLHGNCKGLVK